tara:strand:- start:94 stop:408 length:315 start_codon:yes stop_codon:yes gene_type:complete
MTYPAPMICPYDEWFSEPIMTETQMEYMKLYSVREEDDIVVNMDGGVGGSWGVSKEPENIHQLMYDISTESASITLQLDPLPPLGGGSETFQEGYWQSGIGLLN